jgi:hypothetical protein
VLVAIVLAIVMLLLVRHRCWCPVVAGALLRCYWSCDVVDVHETFEILDLANVLMFCRHLVFFM